MKPGDLYLIPSLLGEKDNGFSLPTGLPALLNRLDYCIAENSKSARRFLRLAGFTRPLDSLQVAELNEHTPREEIRNLLSPLLEGKDAALISEAGAPVIADPGAPLIMHAHKEGIRVIPVAGPSAVMLALMASGMNGQHFTFYGYLSKEKQERSRQIRNMEKLAVDSTQIFIETPYRNQKLLDELLATLRDESRLCIACDITQPEEFIQTKSVSSWKKKKPDIDKRPAVFLIG